MGRLFGTDGIRGLANQHPVTSEVGLALGRAAVEFCRRRGLPKAVVIGRDTRASGEELLHAIASGALSAGGHVRDAGIIPTPGVAYLVREVAAGAGVVVSASHNPFEYNGFKVFSSEGYKLSEGEEAEIEEMLLSPERPSPGPESTNPGNFYIIDDAIERYASFLEGTYPGGETLDGMKIVLDCANGATYQVAPLLFQKLGADLKALGVQPDGRNINLGCGSQHTDALCRAVLERGAEMGLAFDGDGDRLIAVDEKGQPLSGDQILIVCAAYLNQKGRLAKDLVVSTVMSNIGFRVALGELGAKHSATKVGDRYVLEEMRARGAVLGGEDSGHMIFLEHHTTGDGLVSALQLIAAVKTSGKPLSELAGLMTVFPQTLLNVPVKRKPEISSVAEIRMAIESIEGRLGRRGRVLVRYSGTEPLCRVMVEGERSEEVEAYAKEIAGVVDRRLN